METLVFAERKIIRAKVIHEYMNKAGYEGCVCFSCGNASAALLQEGLDTIDVSVKGPLLANRWWTPEEIHRVWPDRFDGTSGHLPAFLMIRLGQAFRNHLRELSKDKYSVPTGSGETITCLRWAYPEVIFIPHTGISPETESHKEAPLNSIISNTRS